LVVGIGASAGGVEALQALFRGIAPQPGIAFIVVTHLGEGRNSALPEIIGRCTTMPVLAIRNDERIQPDHVYVLAADAVITVQRGRLRLRQHQTASRTYHTIDVFFASLAEYAGENAVGIILSGLGTDGTLGAKAIKEKGGLTIAQAGNQTPLRHPEMPASAIAAGAIDLSLPPDAIGAKLEEYAQSHGLLDPDGQPRARREHLDDARQEICQILIERVGHNFSGYKERTFLRRVERRMHVLEIREIGLYLERLRQDRAEAAQLFHDLLIGVTAFFRDREAFDALAAGVIPRLFEGKNSGDPIRVWVPGCSTGEEVYSLAILLLEHMAREKLRNEVQCFATDIDDSAIAIARAARYPAAMLRDVLPERIDRYFTTDAETFTVTKQVRDLCIFSSHSVIRDPPFSRIDLISCRNLLIYLDGDVQNQLVPIFHYALRPGGYLFLGSSENLSRHGDYFMPIEKRHRIFQRRDEITRQGVFQLMVPARQFARTAQMTFVHHLDGLTLRQSVERRVIERFAPAHVVVNQHGDVVHYSTRTGRYLENAPRAPTRQLVAMARRGLRLELRTALNEAIETRRATVRQNVRVELDDQMQIIDLAIEPLPEQDGEALFVVVFSDVGLPRGAEPTAAVDTKDRTDIEHLENDLRDTRERLQSMVEEYETALEELKSANEELVSTNEELQSTNEELETSREETQSINEELNTVNSELQRKIEELDHANDDLRNLFESTPVGMVFLDKELVIRTFTPAITAIFNLIPGDRGRPLTDMTHDLEGVDLRQELDTALRSRQPHERRVARRGFRSYHLMRIHPDNISGGVLVSFVDITDIVAVEEHEREVYEGTRSIIEMALRMADASLGASSAAGGLLEVLIKRLRNLSAVYHLLLQANWNPVALRDLSVQQFGQFGISTEGRVKVEGPPVLLKPKAAIAFATALHELVANAAKYGALSVPEGRVRLDWSVQEPGSPGARLVVVWHESNGPATTEQSGAGGFGKALIENQLKSEIGAGGEVAFLPEGARAHIALPLSTGLVLVSAAEANA
jgi:two-component system CheB/CheR fusion protein